MRELVSRQTSFFSPSRPSTKVLVACAGAQEEFETLIDSGSHGDLISQEVVNKLRIPVEPLSPILVIRAINGSVIHKVSSRTVNIRVSVSGNHTEFMSFYVVESLKPQVILGFPWLCKHTPHLDWSSGRVLSWSSFCLLNCLSSAAVRNPVNVLQPPEPPNLSNVPPVYHDLCDVFCKFRARSLPPHRPYDCAIELLPGTQPPKGHIYPLSPPEQVAMNNYLQESLQAGIIRPSSSPAGAGFFFVGKRDGGLRPCIDYRGLNNITIRNTYPLPLLQTAFDQLSGAQVFTKLDLRSAYHLIRIREGDEWKTAFNTPSGHFEYLVMPFGLTNAPAVFQCLINDVLKDMINKFVFVYLDDILIFSPDLDSHVQHVRAVLQRLLENQLYCKAEKCEFHTTQTRFLGHVVSPGSVQMDNAKVKAVLEWPVPSGRKQLQRFLGFANFCRRFIRGFSGVAAPLHRLTTAKVRFIWDEGADKAFTELKRRFSTTPILTQPDPSKQFIVEVDASESGVGAVLSQRASDNKVHPCAYFSCKLTPAERNYDIGNRELLAVKLPNSSGKTVILTIIDRFSKLVHAIPLQRLPSAKELAVLVSRHLFRLHGLPLNITSDHGPQFVAAFWRYFCNLLGIKVSLSSGFHPQTNGQVERYNQDLETTLRAMCSKNPRTWSSQLPWAEYSHNTLINSSGFSPFQAAYGYQPPLFPHQELLASSVGPAAFVRRCQRTWRTYRHELLRNQER
uniref:ribonuclease H n=1 Tax=Oryzias sinensis TaxID=183150 RepID=A0A8C7ZXU4_9TELE